MHKLFLVQNITGNNTHRSDGRYTMFQEILFNMVADLRVFRSTFQ